MKKELGEKLYDLRQREGLSLRKLSAKTGVPHANINLWEKGMGNIGVVDFIRIARAFGKNPSDMLRDCLKR